MWCESCRGVFSKNEEAHIREAAKEVGFSIGKIWFILRKILKWKPYRPHATTVLTTQHRQYRLTASQWFLSHTIDFFSKQVIWSDEKYFVLKQGPNKSIHRYWAPSNPHILIECKTQSQELDWTLQWFNSGTILDTGIHELVRVQRAAWRESLAIAEAPCY